jgi:phage baseplate assembly protein W
MNKIYNNKVIAKNTVSIGDDVKTFRYRGFSSREFKKNFRLFDFELVKQDLINHFNIRKGEKLENPDFGTIIWDILFEPFTQSVREEIAKDVEKIINFDKRIRVDNLLIDATEYGIRLQAELTYIPLDLKDVLRLDFDRRNSIN